MTAAASLRARFRSQRISRFTESVIREMTRLAFRHNAINLAQGFPDFPAPAALKPLKTAFNKSSLAAHVSEQSGVDAKSVKSVLAALEGAMLMSVNKKGLGSFTLPGLLKVVVQNVPAKKKRMGKDPFTGVERMFAAKPASVKIKTRALKKLKDAAL